MLRRFEVFIAEHARVDRATAIELALAKVPFDAAEFEPWSMDLS